MILRPARTADRAALDALVRASGIALSRGFYSEVQARAVTAQVFGIDSQLIADGTYFAVEDDGTIVAAGGWSRRATLYGGDQAKAAGPDPLLEPARDAARIRAFFVAPGHARRGLGSRLLARCMRDAWAAGFRRLTLAATLPGEPLYRAFGFTADRRFDLMLADGVAIPLVEMSRSLTEAPRSAFD